MTEVPDSWYLHHEKPDSMQSLNFSIILRQQLASLIAGHLLSHAPHLSADEIRMLRFPNQTHVDNVLEWLEVSGVISAICKDDSIFRYYNN